MYIYLRLRCLDISGASLKYQAPRINKYHYLMAGPEEYLLMVIFIK